MGELVLQLFKFRLGLGRADIRHGQIPRELALVDLNLVGQVQSTPLEAPGRVAAGALGPIRPVCEADLMLVLIDTVEYRR